jgi:hypothetical protein
MRPDRAIKMNASAGLARPPVRGPYRRLIDAPPRGTKLGKILGLVKAFDKAREAGRRGRTYDH